MPVGSFVARLQLLLWLPESCCHGPDLACNVDAPVNMLQVGTALSQEPRHLCGHLLVQTCDPNAVCSNNCRIHTHGRDCYRPVEEVMAEHPGEDGYCYFNATAFWVVYAGPHPDFEAEAVSGVLGLRGQDYKGLNQGPLLTYNFDGQEIRSFMDSAHYSFDDLYAYSLGFLQGQGLDPAWMANSTRWMSLSQEACEKLQQTYNFSREELILADSLDFNQPLVAMTYCTTGVAYRYYDAEALQAAGYYSPDSCRPVTRREMAKHHYVKCLLGYRNSAGDMAYLNSRACLLPDNRIGHFSECPYSPPGVRFFRAGRKGSCVILMWREKRPLSA